MADPDLDRILNQLRRGREELERDMDDSATKIDSAGLLQRIEALRKRIEATQLHATHDKWPPTTT